MGTEEISVGKDEYRQIIVDFLCLRDSREWFLHAQSRD